MNYKCILLSEIVYFEMLFIFICCFGKYKNYKDGKWVGGCQRFSWGGWKGGGVEQMKYKGFFLGR